MTGVVTPAATNSAICSRHASALPMIAMRSISESVMAAEIGEILLGRAEGRTSPDQITFFKSVGNAVQDIAVAARVLATATERDLGLMVEL